MEFICNLCPRNCGTIRTDEYGKGICASPALPRLARAAVHFWEEPCISGTKGSGTIFFSGCNLQCLYCQNREISRREQPIGKLVSIPRLYEIMKNLSDQRVHNINFVTPTHYAHCIQTVLTDFPTLSIPIVYNTSGYEKVETLRQLNGLVQIYLTDLKYMDSTLSSELSHASDYFDVASKAIWEMYRQVGDCRFDTKGILQKGVIVRHLILPGLIGKSIALLDWCRQNLPKGIKLSVMSQYTPVGETGKFLSLKRRLKKSEYDRILQYLLAYDMTDCYIQELSSAKEEYIPPFNLEGV